MTEVTEGGLSEEDMAIRRGIIGSIRQSVAPAKGTALIEVGLSSLWNEIYHDFIEITRDTTNGSIVYVMGDYGQGKTFLCNFVREKGWDLWNKGFATSYVEVKEFESLADYVDIYRQIAKNIQLPFSERKGVEHLLFEFSKEIDSRDALNDAIRKMNVEADFGNKIRFYCKNKGYEDRQTIVIRWLSAEERLKATLLHEIGEIGFARVEEKDVDDYLTGLNELVKSLGYEGLLVFIDEAEERTRTFNEDDVRRIFRNVKKLHNNVNQDERFSQMIFLLAGTRELWASYERLDEAQRQRMHAVRRDLPKLSRDDFVQLAKKVIKVFDEAYDESLAERIDDTIVENWVDRIIEKYGFAGPVTPRDFLSERPNPRESFISKLGRLRANPDIDASDMFQL